MYQSIIRIFEYCGIDFITFDAARAKKILAVEFSFATGGIITIDGFDYNKNDVFKELERNDFAERLSTHVLIWKTPSLLDCLEKNEVDVEMIDSWSWLQKDDYYREITSLISPYFAFSFNRIMSKLLDSLRFNDAGIWFKTLHLIDNFEDEHNALRSTRICIADFIKTLKNSNDVTYKSNMVQFEKWFERPWFMFINNLPESLQNVKNELMSEMVNLMYRIQFADIHYCKKLSGQMVSVVDIDSELQALILSNHKIICRNARIRNKAKKRDWGRLNFIIALLLGMLAIRIATCSRNSQTQTMPPIPQFFLEQQYNID